MMAMVHMRSAISRICGEIAGATLGDLAQNILDQPGDLGPADGRLIQTSTGGSCSSAAAREVLPHAVAV